MGFDSDDLRSPLVMVAHEWIGTMPCNFNQRELAQHVMAGVRAAGGTPMEVNTVSISDGISMGTEGMKASLISRELIADSIELCGVGYSFDAAVILVGCDKTIPAASMALARLNIPGLILYSGSIAPGVLDGRDVTIQDVFEGVGAARGGHDHRGAADRHRGRRVSRRRRVRRAVHREHDGDGDGVPRPVADGLGDRRRHGRAQGRRRASRRASS